jgi:hypothetical protein
MALFHDGTCDAWISVGGHLDVVFSKQTRRDIYHRKDYSRGKYRFCTGLSSLDQLTC